MLNLTEINSQNDHRFEVILPSGPLKSDYSIGLIITAYNRPFYLHRTLSSLSKSDLSETIIILVDDCSDDPHTGNLLREFHLKQTPVIKAFRKDKDGCLIHENLRF
jgi:hypothetical protein